MVCGIEIFRGCKVTTPGTIPCACTAHLQILFCFFSPPPLPSTAVNSAYHGTQSSTSSDLSPISDQKSLPRHSRSRYHHHHQYPTNTTPRHQSSGMNLLKAASGGSPTPGSVQKFSPVSANRSNPAIASSSCMISSTNSTNANSTSSNKMLYVKTPTRRMPSSLHFSRISSSTITAASQDPSPS